MGRSLLARKTAATDPVDALYGVVTLGRPTDELVAEFAGPSQAVITAVDSNVLLDVFGADATYGPASRDALRRCRREGALVTCPVAWAEVSAAFPEPAAAADAMARLGIRFDALDPVAAQLAGAAWRAYRGRGGPRDRVIADFLVAAHAQTHAERLLTRDRGFYRSAFADLVILDPTSGQAPAGAANPAGGATP